MLKPWGGLQMTEVIEKARERLALLEAEVEQIRTFLKVYADLSGDKAVDNESDSSDSDEEGASPAEIVAAAKELMAEHRRPLSRSRLVKLLTEKGLKLPGKDKAKNVGTVIWRSKQFDNLAGYGYWPKSFTGWMGQRPAQTDILGSNII